MFYLTICILLAMLSLRNGSMSASAKNSWLLFVYCYLMMYFSLRFRVGIDTLNYMVIYDYLPNLSDLNLLEGVTLFSLEPGWLFLNGLAKEMSDDFYLLQFIQTAIWHLCLFIFLKRYCCNHFLALFLYAVFAALYFNTEIMRESIAVGIFLLNFPYLQKGQYTKYYLLCVVSLMFHISGLITFFFPLCMKLRFNRTFFFILIGFTIVLVPIIFYVSRMPIFTSELFSNKMEKYMNLAESDRLNIFWTLFVVLRMVVHPLLPLIIRSWSKRLKLNPAMKSMESLVCTMMIFGIGCVFFKVMFERFTNYTFIIMIAYTANVLSSKYVKSQYVAIFFIFSAVVYGKYYIDKFTQWFPYYSVFEEVEDLEREERWKEEFNH